MNVLLVARMALQEAIRKRLLLLGIIGSGLFLAIFGIGMALLVNQISHQAARASGVEQALPTVFVVGMTLLGFTALNFMGGLSAIFISVNAVSGELDSGTVHALLARPISRREVLLGKWLGYAFVLAMYIVAMSVSLLAIIYVVAHFVPPAPLPAVALLVLVTLLLLSLSVLGGTFLSTLANGIALFLLYGLAWLAGMVEVIGTALHSDAMVYLGIITSLIIPADAIWRAASYYLQPASFLLAQSMTAGGTMPFASAGPPTPAMLIYAVLYTVAAVSLAVVIFNRRDL